MQLGNLETRLYLVLPLFRVVEFLKPLMLHFFSSSGRSIKRLYCNNKYEITSKVKNITLWWWLHFIIYSSIWFLAGLPINAEISFLKIRYRLRIAYKLSPGILPPCTHTFKLLLNSSLYRCTKSIYSFLSLLYEGTDFVCSVPALQYPKQCLECIWVLTE